MSQPPIRLFYPHPEPDLDSHAPLVEACQEAGFAVEQIHLPYDDGFDAEAPDATAHYVLLFAAAEADELAPGDAWGAVPGDGDDALLQLLVDEARLILLPAGAWRPECPKPKPEEDPEIYTDFAAVHAHFAGRVAAIHLARVENWLNCDVEGECPGVLGCP